MAGQEKRKRSPVVKLAIAGVLVIVLLLAGTVMRMRSRDLDFVPAFSGFVSDTFNWGSLD